jgi:hypothetical protein
MDENDLDHFTMNRQSWIVPNSSHFAPGWQKDRTGAFPLGLF